MGQKEVLFISGSLGLGHIGRDMAIANELRKQNPNIRINWLAGSPANMPLKAAHETIIPESDSYVSDNVPAEHSASGYSLNLVNYVMKVQDGWKSNGALFKQIVNNRRYDLVIGDESFEVSYILNKEPELKKWPFVWMLDFIGMDSRTRNPIEKLGVYFINKMMASNRRSYNTDLSLFVGELEDIPNKKFGIFLSNRRDYARKNRYEFTGNIFHFEPLQYLDSSKIKKMTGYGNEPLVICSVGGTAIGKELLNLCGEAFPIIKQKISDIRMLLVCGPRLSANSVIVPPGVDIKEYIPDLYKHFAACDLAIVQGGGTTTLELTALRRPFLYFPLEGHCEQEIVVAERLARHQAGIKMQFSKTTPESLAKIVISNIGKEVTYPAISSDGAKRAAELINTLL
jgi:UDP-N-acetylglucosamine:LPS N-acetylglucosamine transferase